MQNNFKYKYGKKQANTDENKSEKKAKIERNKSDNKSDNKNENKTSCENKKNENRPEFKKMDKYACRNFCATDTKQVVNKAANAVRSRDSEIYVFINFVTFFSHRFCKINKCVV